MIKNFLHELDKIWIPLGSEPLLFKVIGSGALFLQSEYVRNTKDTDILEIDELTEPIKTALTALAGKTSPLREKLRIYLETVAPAFPFFPRPLLFHPLNRPDLAFKNFRLEVLDITDVIVSKLKPYRPTDVIDIAAMADRGLINHKRLIERFEIAMDRWLLDARAADLPQCIANLNEVERVYLDVPESRFELPEWV